MVAQVTSMYSAGQTQAEIAVALGVSQKVIWNLMQRHGLKARVAAKRNQTGPLNASWKGATAGYQALHIRVQRLRGVPRRCEDCGTTTARIYDWANISGKYDDPNDYRRLCRTCHHRLDGTVKNLH